MSAITWAPDARAALLRDGDGAIVGTTWGGTACWFPKRPKSHAAIDEADGSAHVIRCGWCPGCRELDRQRLSERLFQHFKDCDEPLWVVVVEVKLSEHQKVARVLHRNRGHRPEPAFFRLGEDRIGFIFRGQKPTLPRRLAGRYKSQCEGVRKSRGRRAWALITAGILRAREEYGAWRNRFYHRGLKQLERTREWKFSGKGAPGLRGAATAGVRGSKAGITLHFPEAIALRRLRKRKGLESKRMSGPIPIRDLFARIFGRVDGPRGDRISLSPTPAQPAGPVNDRISNRVRALGDDANGSGRGGRAPVPSNPKTRTLSEAKRTGYQGSLHSGVADFGAWAERMAELARKREKPDDG